MYGDSPAVGHGVQGEVPEWRPLLDAVGEYLAETFMADALRAALSPWWERLNASAEDVVASWSAIARALPAAGSSVHSG